METTIYTQSRANIFAFLSLFRFFDVYVNWGVAEGFKGFILNILGCHPCLTPKINNLRLQNDDDALYIGFEIHYVDPNHRYVEN